MIEEEFVTPPAEEIASPPTEPEKPPEEDPAIKEKAELNQKIDNLTGMSYVMAEQLDNVGYDMIVKAQDLLTRGVEVQSMARQILARARLTPAQQDLVNKSKEQASNPQSNS